MSERRTGMALTWLLFTLLFMHSYAEIRLKGDAGNQATDTDSEDDIDQDMDSRIFQLPRDAKSFLDGRRRKRWNIKSVWGEEQEEEKESRENRREAAVQAHLNSVCPTSCWGSWSGWSNCATTKMEKRTRGWGIVFKTITIPVPCGSSGIQRSTRKKTPPAQCANWVKSHSCPGGTTRTKACNRRCHNGGTLKPIGCTCSPAFSGTCCETRIRCGFPGKPNHGSVNPAGSSHVYGTKARFTCIPGYTLKGASTRTCQATKQWSGAVPTCQIVRCPNPGTLSNGDRRGTNFRYGQSVVYSCNTGYTLKGVSASKCGANGRWSSYRPTCQPITCPALGNPANGKVTVPRQRKYKQAAVYSCNTGYYLRGNNKRVCQLNAQWNGGVPTCQRITCPVLPSPSNGIVRNSGSSSAPAGLNQVASFSCNRGYRLSGSSKRTCKGSGPRGNWDGSQPKCNPVSCRDPGTPAHGSRRGGTFTYLSDIAFLCQPGYVMKGSGAIRCEATAKWNASTPTCSACPVSTYKLGANRGTQCARCPAHSHTSGPASTKRQLCLCDASYRGPPGGPCNLITCPSLNAPAHGRKGACTNNVNAKCSMSCNAGHIRSRGDATRTCLSSAKWSGTQPVCSPCPINLYKASEMRCNKCPNHTHTTAPGQSLQGCVCDTGYKISRPGQPCQDINECEKKKGGCEQTCTNTDGSFACSCTVAGYVINQDDPKKCIAKNKCPAPVSPENGGLVCFQRQMTNTQRCQIKCNPGFEHLDRLNSYEGCGPSTNFKWTSNLQDVVLPCVAQFFPNVSVEEEVAYFVASCNQLTPQQIEEARQNFIALLKKHGICIENGKPICDISQVQVHCGTIVEEEHPWMARRATTKPMLKFDIQLVASQNAQGELSKAVRKLKSLFRTSAPRRPSRPSKPSRPQGSSPGFTIAAVRPKEPLGVPIATLVVGGLVLVPKPGSRTTGSMTADCAEGMELTKGKCVSCPPGTYASAKRCELCSAGTYQPSARQHKCLPCPKVKAPGATKC